jgi:transcriptional regulator with XRE-family HTH domain
VERSRWEGTAAGWANCGVERARALLRGELPTQAEVAALSAASEVAEPELTYGRLADGEDILLQNLRHLFRDVEHGAKTRIALQVGVHPSTISAWLSAKQRPRGQQLERLARVMGLPSGAELETRPLFLSLDPVASEQRRAWLRERIDRLEDRTLAELFPALKRLLESS